MKMSSIHALQSSTSSHKLLQSVRSLRPLLCEALRANGCDPIDINKQGPALQEGDEDDQYLNSHTSGHYDDVYAQCQHVEEPANLHSVPPYHGHMHDLLVTAEDCSPAQEDAHVQYRNSSRVALQAHSFASAEDAIHPFIDVQHHGCGHHDAQSYGYAKHGNTEYGHYDNVYPKEIEHHGDDLHAYWNHSDNHHHGHETSLNETNSVFVNADDLPQIMDRNSELLGTQNYPEQTGQMSCWYSSPMKRECPVNLHPYTPLPWTQYTQGDNHLLEHQHIHAYHNYRLQQHFPSEITAFVNNVLLEAPGTVTNDSLIGVEATNKNNNNNGGVLAQDSSRYSMNNVEVHQVHAGHQANCREVPPLPKSCEPEKKSPKTLLKQLKSSDESEGSDIEEGGKLLSPKDKATLSSANLVCERRRRKKWNESLYALRALVPIVSKMDKLSIVGDTLSYLQQLRDKVDSLQDDVYSLQAEKQELLRSQEEVFTCTSQEMEICKVSPKYKIFELDVGVIDMEQRTYDLSILCKRGDAVLLELTKVLEALDFNMLSASIGATTDQVFYKVVVKVDTAEILPPDMLKEDILKTAKVYGFHL